MSLVNDDELGRGAQEIVPPGGALYEVRGHDRHFQAVEDALADPPGDRALEAPSGGGEHELGRQMELARHLGLPLLGQVRWAEDAEPAGIALLQELPSHKERLDGLADPDVVCDQEPYGVEAERHKERHKLVGAGFDGDLAKRAERAGRGAEPEAEGVA